MLKPTLEELSILSKETFVETKKYFQKLKKRQQKRLDPLMQDLHEKEFEKTDCLECGNCCKTSSPIVTEKDIQRIAKHLRIKEVKLVEQYLERDGDDYYVMQEVPCVFLDTDNSCFIYDVRPKACKEYPHTDRRKFIQLTDLTLKNIEICPATYNIIEELKKKLPL